MKLYSGKSIVDEIVFGEVLVYKKNNFKARKIYIENIDKEIERLNKVILEVKDELQNTYNMITKQISDNSQQLDSQVIKVQMTLLEDEDYIDEIQKLIRTERINAEYAVQKVTDNLVDTFSQITDSYMRERCVDIKENSKKIIYLLNNQDNNQIKITHPVILIAEDILATDVINFDKNLVLGIILKKGTSASHASILVKNKNIPYIINSNIPLTEDLNGKHVLIDGNAIYLEPDELLKKRIFKKQSEFEEQQEFLKDYIGKSDTTLDNRNLKLYCNIGDVKDVDDVLKNDASGIGLFRSEFLYIERNDFPPEEEQFQIYKSIAQKMGDKEFIIRTIDIGSDKDADYFNLKKEENPALGYRAIRICLDRQDIFKTQLRAIYRASVFGNISVMFPMIISEEEIIEIKEIIEEVKTELACEEYEFKNIPIGIMIETPAAVILSDVLAKHVDFFSIGSNDLAQYTLAIDRQNIKLNDRYAVTSQAILRMIYTTIQNAHNANIWVGICGELASDLNLIELLLCMDIDELSVSPNAVLKIRQIIRNFDIEHNREDYLKSYDRKFVHSF